MKVLLCFMEKLMHPILEYVPEGDYYRVKTTKGSAVYRPDKEKGKYKIIRYKEMCAILRICCSPNVE